MTSRHARHDIAESSELDCAAPLLSVYHVLHQLELQGIPLPVRVPLTCCVDFYFIRAMYVMDTRAPRPDEVAHPPPLVLVRKPASDLNSHVLLQEMVEHDWNRRLQRDELSDEDNPHDDEDAFQKFSILLATRAKHATKNIFPNRRDENDNNNTHNSLISAVESAQIEEEIAREMDEDYYGFRSAIVGDNTRFRGAHRHAIWAQVAWFEPESQRMNIEYLNANGIRNLLRNASSRKSRCVVTQFLPPDDTAPQRNEVVICTYAGMFFRMDRRINHHDYRDPSFSLNERGTCEASQHSADVSIPGVMTAKIEECLKDLVQKIEHFASKRVIVLRVAVKLRRGAVWLLYGEELVFFDRSVPRMSDPSVLFAAAAPSSRNELRKRIQIVSRRNQQQQSSSPQSLAQSIIHELAEARRKQMAQAMEKRRQEDLAKKQWAEDQFLRIQQEQQREEQRTMNRMSAMSESRRRRHQLLAGTGGIATATTHNNKSPGGYLSSDQLKLLLKKNRQHQRILKNNGVNFHGSTVNSCCSCSPCGSNPGSLNASVHPNQQKEQNESIEKNTNRDLFLPGNDIFSVSSGSNADSVDVEIGNNVVNPATKREVARNLILGDMQEEAELMMKQEEDEGDSDDDPDRRQLPTSPKSVRFENNHNNNQNDDDDTNLKPLSPSDYLHNDNKNKDIKNDGPLPVSPSPLHRQFSTIPSVVSHQDDDDDDDDETDSDDEDDNDDEDFFLTETEREEQRKQKRRAKLTKQEKERLHQSASRWLKGEEPLFSEDDFAAIELMREELGGMSSKRLGQFRSSGGIVAPSLLFMKLKIEEAAKYDKLEEERSTVNMKQQQQQSSSQNHKNVPKSLEFLTINKRNQTQKPSWNGTSNESYNNYDPLKRKDLLPTSKNKQQNQEELRQAKEEDKNDKRRDHLEDCEIDNERFWKFREKILTARVDAALRRNVLMNFRVGQLQEQ